MAGDSYAKDLIARELIARSSSEFPEVIDNILFESLVRTLLGMDRDVIRDKAARNVNLRKFIESPRFLLEFSRLTGTTSCLPPAEYVEQQMINGGFPYKKNIYQLNLSDFVFDKTRHGFAPRDIPFDANHGVRAIQDAGGCTGPCPLRNIFVLENMNVPVCRFDPTIFCQSWTLALLRPKFVFRGMAACPRGDYGLMRLIVEIGNSKGSFVRSEVSIPFKKGDESRCGRFVPFEVDSPEYDFRPNHVFFFVCVFYVNQTEIENRGMRIANCSVQCVLPSMPSTLENIPNVDAFPVGTYDAPPHVCNYTVDSYGDPEYLKALKKDFYSVLDSSQKIRKADLARAEEDIEKMLGGNLLEEKMDVGEEGEEVGDKRKRSNADDEEPLTKRAHITAN